MFYDFDKIQWIMEFTGSNHYVSDLAPFTRKTGENL